MGIQDYQASLVLERKIEVLELRQEQWAGAGQIQQGPTDFSLSCTCPPSTSIIFRGGLAWWRESALWPAGFILPTYPVDLADVSKCSVLRGHAGYSYTFTNPYWYMAELVIISDQLWAPDSGMPPYPSSVPDAAIELYGGTAVPPYVVEHETALEAEEYLMTLSISVASGYGIVAGGIILRNNGNVVDPNQYQAIDPINRGGSYLFSSKGAGWWR